jgi:hypothetical protein
MSSPCRSTYGAVIRRTIPYQNTVIVHVGASESRISKFSRRKSILCEFILDVSLFALNDSIKGAQKAK